MHAFTNILYFLGLLALVAASPTKIQKRGVYKVERVRNEAFTGHNGPRALLKAYRKYSMPIPPELLQSMMQGWEPAAQPAAAEAVEVLDVNNNAATVENAAGSAAGAATGAATGATAAGGAASMVDSILNDVLGALGQGQGKANGQQQAKGNGNGTQAKKGKGAGAAGAAANATAPARGQQQGKGKGAGAGAGAAAGAKNGTAPARGQQQGKGKGAGAGAGAAAGAKNGTGAAVNAAGVGLVTATPEGMDVEYLSPVNIGGQTLNLDFDSGSSDLWVFSTQQPQAQTANHQPFDTAKSKSFAMAQGQTFTISYGDGSGAAGVVGTDTVNIGGATVTKQAVELATAVSQSFVDDQNSQGLLGLAFSQLNTVKPQKQKTFFDNVMPSLAEPVFTADLRKNAVGAYEFGRIDNTKFKGAMAWIPVNSTQGFWQFTSQQFAVGTGQPQQSVAGAQAIADTGTTLIIANQKTVDGYYSQIPGAANNPQVGGVTVPCDAQLPDLMLDVGGVYMAKVKGSDINFAPISKGSNTCFGGMQATTGNLQIYGDIFFKSQFVAFNGGNKSLGMAEHI